MSHVDDGLLHAYLDGERAGLPAQEVRRVEHHLAACPECRARLEEASLLRARAGEILLESGPGDLPQPPFEEVEARTPARTQRRQRLAVGAWAASLALAVGLGWFARDRLARPPAELALEAPERSAAGATATTPAPEPAPMAAAASTEDLREAVVTAPAPSSPSGEPDAASAPPATAGAAAAARGAAPGNPPAAESEERATPDARRVTLDAVAVAPQSSPAETRAGPPAPVPASAPPAPPLPPERRAAAPGSRLPVLVLDGLPVVSVSTREEGGEPEVRVEQRLPDGGRIELVQRRAAGADPPADEPVRQAGISTVVIHRDGYRITARAALSPDSLRALLARLPLRPDSASIR